MRVFHINLNFNQSGLYTNFANSLIKQGCKLKVFYPTTQQNKQKYNLSYLEKVDLLNKYDRYFFKRRNRKIVNYIEQEKIINDYNLLHAHSLFSNGYIAYTLKKKYNIPYVVAVRDTDLNHFFKKRILLKKLGIEILKEADKINLLSQPYKELLLNKYVPKKIRNQIDSKIEVIPNGINQFWHRNIMRRTDFQADEKLNILSVGVISKRKNILTSIKACEILINKGKEVQLTVIGEGQDHNILERIKKHEFVTYVPRVSKEKLLDYYRKSDLFLMPSITETFGLVYAEAMSQGLPVLYSKGQGFDKQFTDGTVGYPVEKMNPDDIANKILLTLKNYDKISANCTKLVDKFDWNKISNEYIEIYKNILGVENN